MLLFPPTSDDCFDLYLLEALADHRTARPFAESDRPSATPVDGRRLVAAALAALAREDADSTPAAEDVLAAVLTCVPLVEQARGVVMAHLGVDASIAAALLRRWSVHQGTDVRELCCRLLTAAVVPAGSAGGGLQALVASLQTSVPGSDPQLPATTPGRRSPGGVAARRAPRRLRPLS